MGNWIPNDPTLVAQILKISSSYSPPPPEGFVSPMTWGVEDNVIERFAGAGVPKEKISFERDTWTFNSPGRPSDLLAVFRTYYGPILKAFAALDERVRSRRSQRPGSRSASRAASPVQRPEREPERRCHIHSRDLPVRDGRALSQFLRARPSNV